MTQDQAATTIVQLLREQILPTLRKAYGRKRTLEIQNRSTAMSVRFAKDANYRITHSDVYWWPDRSDLFSTTVSTRTAAVDGPINDTCQCLTSSMTMCRRVSSTSTTSTFSTSCIIARARRH